MSELELLTKRIAELEARNRQLEESQGELLQSQKLESIGRLASGVAHEINTPVQFVGDSIHFLSESITDILNLMSELLVVMNSIVSGEMSIQMVESTVEQLCQKYDYDYLVSNIPKSVQRSADGLARVSEIVQSMKAFAHPDQKTMSAMSINQSLLITLSIAKNEYKYVADVETDFGDIPDVEGYTGELNQVFLNLIVNASHAIDDVFKATNQRGLIKVRTRRDGDHVSIEISDTGGGIPADIHSRIFDPFFTTKELGKGTGQGLAIAHKVVTQMHSGELGFTTEVGRGTTFSIRIPIEQGTQNKAA